MFFPIINQIRWEVYFAMNVILYTQLLPIFICKTRV